APMTMRACAAVVALAAGLALTMIPSTGAVAASVAASAGTTHRSSKAEAASAAILPGGMRTGQAGTPNVRTVRKNPNAFGRKKTTIGSRVAVVSADRLSLATPSNFL